MGTELNNSHMCTRIHTVSEHAANSFITTTYCKLKTLHHRGQEVKEWYNCMNMAAQPMLTVLYQSYMQ